MEIKKVQLGKTGLMVTKTAMGCLPIQRISHEAAKELLRKAYDNGINYYDTANMYTDSEEKIGEALHDVRHNIVISTKSGGTDYKTVTEHIELSLKRLQTDYIDIFQFHNPAVMPSPEDEKGAYAAALDAKLATEKDIELVKDCKTHNMGFIAMKGLSGGMLTNAAACYAFMQEYDNVVPIWGIQHDWEMDQWLKLTEADQQMTEELKAVIEKDRKELSGNFCRSCGYCLPCTVDIDIPQAARMAMLLRRSPYKRFMTDEWHAKMQKIEECVHCDLCKSRCPYGLDTPSLLQYMLKDYNEFYAEHHND